jgi:RNA polymerase sigma-70 factor, ECF subfamily
MEEAPHEHFLRLYKPVHEPFARYCSNHAYGLMDAEDLMQETILAALKHFDSIRDKEKLLMFMMATANNIMRNLYRRKKFSGDYNEKAFRKLESKNLSPDTALDIHYMHRALQELPVKDKEAILLFEISGFSIEEIAVIQNSSSGATKTRLSRAREKLRVLLSEPSEKKIPAASIQKLFMLL